MTEQSSDVRERTVYVSIPPNREGIARESVVAADTPRTCADQMARQNDLPVSATDLSNWTLVRSTLEAESSDTQGRLWRFDHYSFDGVYYIEETELATTLTNTGSERND